jgi:hypothetical protein
MSFVLTDEKDRVIASVSDEGKIAVSRQPDMTQEMKEYIVDVFSDLTGQDPQEIMAFLNYEEEEELFCS